MIVPICSCGVTFVKLATSAIASPASGPPMPDCIASSDSYTRCPVAMNGWSGRPSSQENSTGPRTRSTISRCVTL